MAGFIPRSYLPCRASGRHPQWSTPRRRQRGRNIHSPQPTNGGWFEFQFAERRMPTLDEINAVAQDTPVFLPHPYNRALLNRAALQAGGYTRATPNPPGGEIQLDATGEPTGLLIARPNGLILYATLAKRPKLPLEQPS
jgi:hypothetical protein